MKKILLFLSALFLAGSANAQVQQINQKASARTLKTVQCVEKQSQSTSRKAPARAQGVVVPGEGTSKPYSLGCYAQGWFGLTWSSGLSTSIIWSNDGKDVWFGNLFPASMADGECYIHGSVEGNTITVEKQYAYEGFYENYGYTGINVTCCAVEADEDGNVTNVLDSFTMNIEENGNISMTNPDLFVSLSVLDENGNITTDDAGNQQVWDYCMGYVFIALNESDLQLVELPEGAEPKEYLVSMTDSYDATSVSIGNIAFVGNEAYIQGLSTMMPESWVKGEVSEDGKTISIPSGQYVGLAYDLYMISFSGIGGGEEDEEGNYTYSFVDTTHFDLGEDGVWSLRMGEYFGDVAIDGDGIYSLSMAATLAPYAGDVAETPEDPTVAIYDYSAYSSGIYLDFNFTLVGVNGNYINPKNLYYRLYMDGEPMDIADYYPEVYNEVGSDLFNVLYNSTDGNFYGSAAMCEITLNDDMWNTIGVQLINIVDGKEYRSNIVTTDIDGNVDTIDGIKNINSDSVKTCWYDLSGRKVAKNTKGIVIANGSKMKIK